MNIEIDGYCLTADVLYYRPAIAGTYSKTADNDTEYWGCAPELDYIVTSISLEGKPLDRTERECFLAVFEDSVYDAVLAKVMFEQTCDGEGWE